MTLGVLLAHVAARWAVTREAPTHGWAPDESETDMSDLDPTMYRRADTTVWAMPVTDNTALNHRIQHWADLHTSTGRIVPVVVPKSGLGVIVHTPDGTHTAVSGDYVIHDTDGHFYPCKPEIFHKTYEEVS